MSHFKHTSKRTQRGYMAFMIGGVFVFLFTCMELFMQNAYAATISEAPLKGKTHRSNPHYLLKSDLSSLTGIKTAKLDWQQPSLDLYFDLPAHDWYETLDLFISATPLSRVSRRTPLLISFNGGTPVPLVTRGQKFDAHIRLQPSQITSLKNVITITYQTPSDVDCLNASHGQWQIDMAASKLVAKSRAKRRAMTFTDIAKRLKHPMTSPRRIALIATGEQKTELEALGAMAMAQRTHKSPQFSLSSGLSDFNLIMGTYSDIRSKVRDKNKLKGHSAILFIDQSTKPTLVISGPTSQQVVALARNFAQKKLPLINRSSLNAFDLHSTQALSAPTVLDHQPQALASLGTPLLIPSWHPSSTHLNFSTLGARTKSGTVVLKIESSGKMIGNGRLGVFLNNQSLGYTQLDKPSKRVSFDIKLGQLLPANNRLEFLPILNAHTPGQSVSGFSCRANLEIPSVSLGENSFIKLTESFPDNINQLNTFSAAGAPFSGKNGQSHIILSASTQRDKIASLNFLGFTARTIGPNWARAKFSHSLPDLTQTDENILFIGPNLLAENELLKSAPDGLLSALSGKPARGQNLRTASFHRQASLSSSQAFQIAAQSKSMNTPIKSGGVIALYPSALHKNKMIGVISSHTRNGFHRAITQLSNRAHWNAMQGSVSRWNDDTVLMTQIAQPLPAGFATEKTKSSLITTLKMLPASAEHYLDVFLLTHDIPSFKNYKLSFPSLKKYSHTLQNIKRKIIPLDTENHANNETSIVAVKSNTSIELPATPRLKPTMPSEFNHSLRPSSSFGSKGTTISATNLVARQNTLPQMFMTKWAKAKLTMRSWRLEVRPLGIALKKKINGLLQNRMFLLGLLALIGFLLMGSMRPTAIAGQKG